MRVLQDRARKVAAGMAAMALVVGGGVGLWRSGMGRRPSTPPAHYMAQGYGGVAPGEAPEGSDLAPVLQPPAPGTQQPTHGAPSPAAVAEEVSPDLDPVAPAKKAYNLGEYQQAGEAAEQVITEYAGTPRPGLRKKLTQARLVLAYSQARQKDFASARGQFALIQQEASRLRDHGKPRAGLGENPPALEEEGAYQHAVLTAALERQRSRGQGDQGTGGQGAGERELVEFMQRYPESPLVQAAIKRITRMHGGNVPREAGAAWKQAMKVAQERQKARRREVSLCGPECLAELLRRKSTGQPVNGSTSQPVNGSIGQAVSASPIHPLTPSVLQSSTPSALPEVQTLAREMKTNEDGTTMEALAEAAKNHGFSPRGLALTQKGLEKQALPVVALVAPGHYVLVDAVAKQESGGSKEEGGVTIWDPDANGPGQPGVRNYALTEWKRVWGGAALAIQ